MQEQTTPIYSILSYLLLGIAFFLPISIALVEPLAFLAIILWLYAVTKTKRWRTILRCPLAGPVIVFVLIAMVVSFFGVRPAHSMHKFHRLFLFMLIFVIHDVMDSKPDQPAALRQIIIAFIAGAVVLGCYDVIRIPVQVAQGRNWFDAGNMRDPQFYLVALSFLCAYLLFGSQRTWPLWISLLLCGAGLVLHFKRGVWFSFMLGMSCLAIVVRKWKLVALVALCALLLLLVPQVRQRLVQIHDEFQVEQGGRVALWTRVAPALISQHPWGMGFCSIQHEDLVPYAPYIQHKLSHLHNNLLQITVETGWLGLAAWLIWMSTTMVLLFTLCSSPPDIPFFPKWIACGTFGAFTGLMINGLVESNISDTEILILLALLMGITCSLWNLFSDRATVKNIAVESNPQ